MANLAAIWTSAYEAVADKKLVTRSQCEVSNKPPGDISWNQLNIKRASRPSGITLLLDVVVDSPGPIDFDELTLALAAGDRERLPEVLQTPEDLPQNTMQFSIVRSATDKFTVVRMFHFKEKVDNRVASSCKKGELYQIDWEDASDKRLKRMALTYLWHRLGGYQYSCQFLEDTMDASREVAGNQNSRAPKLLTAAEIDRGYDFIKESREVLEDLSNNALNRFIKKQLNDPESPIFGWNKNEIIDGFRSLQADGDSSHVQTNYPLDLRDCESWLAPFLFALLPKLLTTSLIMLGENSMGKTSFAIILSMCFARYWIARNGKSRKPSYRLTQDVDALRNMPGKQEQPVIADDCGLENWGSKELKAYFDMKSVEAAVRARWTRATFHPGQLRIATDNSYCEELDLGAQEMTIDVFLDLIRPSFPKLSKANVMAVLKRANVLVNTRTHVVLKLAAENKFTMVPVPKDRMYIKSGCKDILKDFFVNHKQRPQHKERVNEEQRVLLDILSTSSDSTGTAGLGGARSVSSFCISEENTEDQVEAEPTPKRARFIKEEPKDEDDSVRPDSLGVIYVEELQEVSVEMLQTFLSAEEDDRGEETISNASGGIEGLSATEGFDNDEERVPEVDVTAPVLAVAEQIDPEDAMAMIQQNHHERATELEELEGEAKSSYERALALRGGE